ncbi:Copine-8 [Larimichthys crocea]|uniref:Uncharacterized protein n=1 Tax=Larimichthys crocea TaxID=215358 RepID=A0ACD3RBM1_LARCR|nr:Copine-8 [Larimichthys crocea]
MCDLNHSDGALGEMQTALMHFPRASPFSQPHPPTTITTTTTTTTTTSTLLLPDHLSVSPHCEQLVPSAWPSSKGSAIQGSDQGSPLCEKLRKSTVSNYFKEYMIGYGSMEEGEQVTFHEAGNQPGSSDTADTDVALMRISLSPLSGFGTVTLQPWGNTKGVGTKEWREFGRTEVIDNTRNPDFVRKFVLDFFFEEKQNLRFDV